MLAGLFQDKVIRGESPGRKRRGFRDAAVTMTSLGESAPTISHSCRGPEKMILWDSYCDSCLNVKKQERGARDSQKTKGRLNFLGGFSRWDVLASRCDGAALRASLSGRPSAARELISDSQFKHKSSLLKDPWKWLILFESQAKQFSLRQEYILNALSL